MVVNLHLPGVDGITLIRRVRGDRRHARVPVALMTADYLLDDRTTNEIESLGAPLYFKPLWEDDLVEIVERLLARSEEIPAACEKIPADSAAP